MKTKQIILGIVLFTLVSCGQKSGGFNISDYIQGEISDLEYSVSGDEVRVPYTKAGGVKTVKCLINGTILADMIIDSGCSTTLISIDEAKYLASKGALTSDDYLGDVQATIADGSIVENAVFNIKSIVIADKLEAKNVTVTVSANSDAPLLLGNEVLDRIAKWGLDNQSEEIVFTLK